MGAGIRAVRRALTQYDRGADPEQLHEDLGFGAGVVARIVPAVRERLGHVEGPAALQPDEERFRLLDAVAQFLIATSARAPLMLVADDLQWSDRGTITMFRHLARFPPRHRILLVGAYRDGEIDAAHPLGETLAAMRRETSFEAFPSKDSALRRSVSCWNRWLPSAPD